MEELSRIGIESLHGLEGAPVQDGPDFILRRLVSRRRSEPAANIAGRLGPQLDDPLASGPHLGRREGHHRSTPQRGILRERARADRVRLGRRHPVDEPEEPVRPARQAPEHDDAVFVGRRGVVGLAEELEGLDRPAGGAAVEVEQPDP